MGILCELVCGEHNFTTGCPFHSVIFGEGIDPEYSFYIVFHGELNYFDKPNEYKLCESDILNDDDSGYIKIWPSDIRWTIEEATEPYDFSGLNRKMLETVINEDLAQFLEDVVDENTNACFTTNSKYWP